MQGMVRNDESNVVPGIYSGLVRHHFTPEESTIIDNIGKEWYVTNGGSRLSLGQTSNYKYFLVKPTNLYRETFNLSREIIVLLSPYSTFESRTLDAIEPTQKAYQQLRLERVVTILISKDPDIETKIKRLLATERETQIVVPFTYDELATKYTEELMVNRFRDHFYSRDLFAYEAQLTKD